MRAGRVGGVAMNGGSLQKVALALTESRDSVLQTLVRSVVEYSEVACRSRLVSFHADRQICTQFKHSNV